MLPLDGSRANSLELRRRALDERCSRVLEAFRDIESGEDERPSRSAEPVAHQPSQRPMPGPSRELVAAPAPRGCAVAHVQVTPAEAPSLLGAPLGHSGVRSLQVLQHHLAGVLAARDSVGLQHGDSPGVQGAHALEGGAEEQVDGLVAAVARQVGSLQESYGSEQQVRSLRVE